MPPPKEKPFRRADRLGDRLKEELARLLLMEIKDPRLHGVVITAARMSDDLKTARVFYYPPQGADQKAIEKGLASASGFLKSASSKALGLRFTPSLTFEYDDSIDQGSRIEKLLSEAAQKQGGAHGDTSS
ncbi:MAG: Ribosome-binding factor A [Myxococcota bacterium]|nr:Ribosome-binding factor A [Myxococcota bacterium]